MSKNIPGITPNVFNRYDPKYQKDEISLIGPSHHYLGKTVFVPQPDGKSKCIIDDVIVITGIDARTRKAACQYFDSLANNASQQQQERLKERNIGIAATAIGVSMCIPLAFAAPLAAGIGAAVFATVGGVAWNHNQRVIDGLNVNMNTLQAQREQWSDPADAIIEQRKKVGTEGFQYVFNNNLKNSIVHPAEVSALWTVDFIKLLKGSIDIHQVFSQDILGKTRYEYAWNGQLPNPIQIDARTYYPSEITEMTKLYRDTHQAFQIYEKEINKELNAIAARRNELANEISAQRAQWTVPAERMHFLANQEAESIYNSALNTLTRERDVYIANLERDFYYMVRDPSDIEEVAHKAKCDALCRDAIEAVRRDFANDPSVVAIRRAYEKDCRMNTLLYTQSKLVVDNFFDQRLRELDKEVALAKQKVNEQKLNGSQHFTNLLNRILHSGNQTDLDRLVISTPQITRQWTISNSCSKLEWNDVYGNRPVFLSTFANDISRLDWDRFWGMQGLGRFASQPMHSWSSYFSDRSHFPFQDDWFSVRRCFQSTARPRYCRPVVVPPPPYRSHVYPDRYNAARRTSAPVDGRNHVPVGTGRAAPRDTRPQAAPTRQTESQHSPERAPVGSRTTERHPERPAPSVERERTPLQNRGERVQVGYGATERRPERPAPEAEREKSTAPQRGGDRVTVGYASTIRR